MENRFHFILSSVAIDISSDSYVLSADREFSRIYREFEFKGARLHT